MTSSDLKISQRVSIPLTEIELRAIRAQGPGGQSVNKTATAIELRFDIGSSSLPEFYKRRLLTQRDRRINRDGVVVIKAQNHRTQERNREAALVRLRDLIRTAGTVRRKRVATRPGRKAREKRLEEKKKRGRTKALRRPVEP